MDKTGRVSAGYHFWNIVICEALYFKKVLVEIVTIARNNQGQN